MLHVKRRETDFLTRQMVVSLIVVNLTVLANWVFNLKDDDSSESGPSAHMNTFLKGRLSGRNRLHETTTIGLSTLTPARIGITTVVDTEKGKANEGNRVAFASQSLEQVDVEAGSIPEKVAY